MRFSARLFGGIAATLLAAAPAAPATPSACRRVIAKASARHVRAVVQALQRCEDRKVSGAFGPLTDCTQELGAATSIARAEEKLHRAVARRCGGADRQCGTADDDALGTFGWDVEACPDFDGASCDGPVDDCDDVSDCLACVGRAAAEQGTALDYGSLAGTAFGTGSALNRCQRAIGRESARYFGRAVTALQRCWDARLRGRHANPCPDPGDGKTVARLTRAALRKQKRICAACGGPDAACGGAGDLGASEIGFAPVCPALTMPTGPACSAAVQGLGDVVACAGCVTDHEAECVAMLATSGLVPYPVACGVTAETTTTTVTVVTTTSTSATATSSTTLATTTTTTATTSTSSSTTTTSTITLPTTSTLATTTTTSATLPLTTTTTTSLPTTTTSTNPGSTSTTSTSTTTTTTLAPCPPAPPARLGNVTLTLGVGSTDCGGPGLAPNATAPYSGELDLADTSKRADLGLGCLYVGGGGGTNLPGARLPDGGVSVLTVAGVSGTQLTITASNGSGPADCTKGAGPGRHCLNGSSGTDGMGACAVDADCGGTATCQLDANCYFGPPIPIDLGGASTCIMNAIAHDVCGTADLTTRETTATAALSSRLYLTGGGGTPCPQCIAGTCTAGARQGLACSGGIGTGQTTLECPPSPAQYAGTLPVTLSPLSTGTTVLGDPDGEFCPGQRTPGAFGGPAAQIRETGSPLLGSGSTFATTLAGAFCVPSSGSSLFDVVADLPGPGAVSAPGTMAVCLLPDICSTVCNPCTLGPLCDAVCGICSTLCLP